MDTGPRAVQAHALADLFPALADEDLKAGDGYRGPWVLEPWLYEGELDGRNCCGVCQASSGSQRARRRQPTGLGGVPEPAPPPPEREPRAMIAERNSPPWGKASQGLQLLREFSEGRPGESRRTVQHFGLQSASGEEGPGDARLR